MNKAVWFCLGFNTAAMAVGARALYKLFKQGMTIMESTDRIEIALGKLDTTTNRLAAANAEVAKDLREVRDQLRAGVSPEKAAEIATRLEGHATTLDASVTELEAIGADPADPVPDPTTPAE